MGECLFSNQLVMVLSPIAITDCQYFVYLTKKITKNLIEDIKFRVLLIKLGQSW